MHHGEVEVLHAVNFGGCDVVAARDAARDHVLDDLHEVADPQRLDRLSPPVRQRDQARAPDQLHHAAKQSAVSEHEPQPQHAVARGIEELLEREFAPAVVGARPFVGRERREEDQAHVLPPGGGDQALAAFPVHAVGVAMRPPVFHQRPVHDRPDPREVALVEAVGEHEATLDGARRQGGARLRRCASSGRAGRAHECAHRVAARNQVADEMAADEAARPGHAHCRGRDRRSGRARFSPHRSSAPGLLPPRAPTP